MKNVRDVEKLKLPELYGKSLKTYIDIISKLDYVQEIYLFGSCARGSVHEQSDIDLMVLVDEGLEEFNTAVKIGKNLSGVRDIPLDMLVNQITTFYGIDVKELTIQKTILEDGVLLYVK